MKKQIANLLSSARIVIALVLFTFKELTPAYLWLHLVCGLTDLLDGPIARATKSESLLGSRLDAAGDVLTYLAMCRILVKKKLLTMITLFTFLPPLLIMLVSAFIALARFHEFYFIHTALAKLFGFGCFFLPLFALNGEVTAILTFLWIAALAGGIEMCVIMLMSNHADADILSVLLVKKENEKYAAQSL